MSNAVFFNSYKIKKDSSAPEFTQSVDNLVREYASKQPGFNSMALLHNDEMWADFAIFETMEDAKSFENPTESNEHAEKFYSFLNFSTCKSRMFSVEKECLIKSEIPKAVTLVTFTLKKDALMPDFLLAKDNVYKFLPSANKGCIASRFLTNGDMWADLVFWQSIDDVKNTAEYENDVFRKYFSFINKVTFTQHFNVEQWH